MWFGEVGLVVSVNECEPEQSLRSRTPAVQLICGPVNIVCALFLPRLLLSWEGRANILPETMSSVLRNQGMDSAYASLYRLGME